MSNPPPYRLKGIRHESASAIMDYCACDALAAYHRNFVGVPTVPVLVAMVFGNAIHKLLERAGKTWWKSWKTTGRPFPDANTGRNWPKAAMLYVTAALDEKHGSRGECTPPEKILWVPESMASLMSEADLREKIEETKGRYRGLSFNIMEAFRQQFEAGFPPNLQDMVFEQPIEQKKYALVGPGGQRYPIQGSVDVIRVFSEAYEVDDYKTGWIISKYKDRIHLVNDLQMTLYWHALKLIKGHPPARMFIQPLDVYSKELKDHGPETLRMKRILVPERTEEHVRDITALGSDVYEMVDMIVRKHHFSTQQRNEWQPHSSFGRMAGFAQSVRECRFIPRIGKWCQNCQFEGFCRKDHAEDWERNERELTQIEPKGEGGALPVVISEPILSETGMLPFDEPKRKASSRSNAVMKRELVASGDFIPAHKLMATLKRFRNAVFLMGSCPCERLNLYPVWLISCLPLFMKSRTTPNLRQLAEHCPCPDCPHRKPASE